MVITRLKINNMPREKLLGNIVFVVIIAAVVGGFYYAGTPQQARNEGLDQIRVRNIENIKWQVNSHWSQHGTLPESLAEIQTEDFLYDHMQIHDPESGEEYGYIRVSDTQYQLCATFATDSTLTDHIPDYLESDRLWQHPAGEYCFDRETPDEEYEEPKPVRIVE